MPQLFLKRFLKMLESGIDPGTSRFDVEPKCNTFTVYLFGSSCHSPRNYRAPEQIYCKCIAFCCAVLPELSSSRTNFLIYKYAVFCKSATEQHGTNSGTVFLQRYTETGFKISSKTTSQFSDHFHTFSFFFTLFHCFDVDSPKNHSFSLYFTI